MTTWTKSDAASEQLDAAIGLLAERRLVAAAHTLAAAALELATDVARASGKRTNATLLDDLVRKTMPEELPAFRRGLRAPQNFAKHADRDHGDVLTVNPELTVVTLLQAVTDMGIAFERQTFRQVIFRTWFMARYPQAWGGAQQTYIDTAQGIFGRVDLLKLEEALDILQDKIADLDDAALRARFEKSMNGAQIDWSASVRAWDGKI